MAQRLVLSASTTAVNARWVARKAKCPATLVVLVYGPRHRPTPEGKSNIRLLVVPLLCLGTYPNVLPESGRQTGLPAPRTVIVRWHRLPLIKIPPYPRLITLSTCSL